MDSNGMPPMHNSPLPSAPAHRSRFHQASDRAISWVAAAWGICIVLPVGMQYLCLLLLVFLLGLSGRWRESFQSLYSERFWIFSVVLFLSVTALTLATQNRYYSETPSNLLHGLRIVLTLAVGLSLRGQEVARVLACAALAICSMSVLVILGQSLAITYMPEFVRSLIPDGGNRWINLSIMLSIALIVCLRSFKRDDKRAWLWSLAMGCLSLVMILFVMNQRIAVVAVIVGIVCLLGAWARFRVRFVAVGFAVAVGIVASLYHSEGPLRTKFAKGIEELSHAQIGQVSTTSSIGIRYHMYANTTQMILDRPWSGWGIGGWKDQWKKRVDPALHPSNMPHNDFLWMGAQSGWPGGIAWLCLMLSLCWMSWKQRNEFGNIAFAAAAIALVSSLVNSATRDASMGLPMLFVVSAMIARARSHQ